MIYTSMKLCWSIEHISISHRSISHIRISHINISHSYNAGWSIGMSSEKQYTGTVSGSLPNFFSLSVFEMHVRIFNYKFMGTFQNEWATSVSFLRFSFSTIILFLSLEILLITTVFELQSCHRILHFLITLVFSSEYP